ncbi:MAG: protein translocase subunit SecF [bacterium]|nr:protein translocase subunit SecF [bacterium]
METLFSRHSIILVSFGVLVALALAVLLVIGIPLGIEFTGGSMLEVEFEGERPSLSETRLLLSDIGIREAVVQGVEEAGLVIRTEEIGDETRAQILSALGEGVQEMRFESIGPAIGQELREQTIAIAFLSLLAIVLYVAFAFRRTSSFIMPWHYSSVALLVLLYDMIVLLGFLVIAGLWWGVHITIPVVIAVLMVLGYSINNTVVIFDRIRENILRNQGDDFLVVVARSFEQTFSRSVNTSLTTLIVLVAIFFFGGETLAPFSLTLIAGITIGTISSLLLAPAALLWFSRRQEKY